MLPVQISNRQRTFSLADVELPLDLAALLPSPPASLADAADTMSPADMTGAPWEVELGFGKGRYLLQQAQACPDVRFLGVEVVSKYYRMARDRSRRKGLDNLLVVRADALYLMSSALPTSFARRVHVYFPDPWPKARHHKRRMFDAERVDLVLGLLQPGGTLCFATDFLRYGERVQALLEGYPGLDVQVHPEPWPDGARTNYEAKYIDEGRPILRLEATLSAPVPTPAALHPAGRAGILAIGAMPEDLVSETPFAKSETAEIRG